MTIRSIRQTAYSGGPYLATALRLPLFFALRFLTRQKGSFSAFIIRLAAGATALSVAVMILSAAVVTGFQHTIQEKIYVFWGHILITPFTANPSNLTSDEPIAFDASLLQQIEQTASGSHITPYALRPAILRTDSALEGLQLKGVSEDYVPPAAMDVSGKIDFSDTAYSKDILLSQTLANRLRLKKGDAVMLYLIDQAGAPPRIRKITVAGLYHTGLDEVDRNFALCDLRLVQRLSNWASTDISGYQIDLDHPEGATAISDALYEQVLAAPLRSYTLPERYPQIFDWLNLQETNVRVLMSIMAAIAIINLAAALLILLVDRARTVGLLQALGMSRRSLMQLFIYLASGIGVIGCLLGTGLALLLAFLQQTTGFMKLPEETYYMRTVPVQPLLSHILLINGLTLVLCLLCMTLPALYLRRISPTKVLQFR